MGINDDITAFLGADGCERLLRRRAVYRSELIKDGATIALIWGLMLVILVGCGIVIYNAGIMDIDTISEDIAEYALIMACIFTGEFIADAYRVKRILLMAEKEVKNNAGLQ